MVSLGFFIDVILPVDSFLRSTHVTWLVSLFSATKLLCKVCNFVYWQWWKFNSSGVLLPRLTGKYYRNFELLWCLDIRGQAVKVRLCMTRWIWPANCYRCYEGITFVWHVGRCLPLEPAWRINEVNLHEHCCENLTSIQGSGSLVRLATFVNWIILQYSKPSHYAFNSFREIIA